MRRLLLISLWLGSLLTVSAVHAQESAPAPVQGPAPDTSQCTPPCRDGYLCSNQGQCVSACNPACGPGEHCTSLGECIADENAAASEGGFGGSAAAASAPPYPSGPPVPQRQPAPAPEHIWQPTFEDNTPSERYHTRLFTGFTLGLFGQGRLHFDDVRPGDDDDVHESMGPGGGLELGVEFRFARYFGLAPGLRFFRAPFNDLDMSAGVFELFLNPTFHIPMGSLEFILPVSLGLGFANVDADPSLPAFSRGDDDGSGPGLSIGFLPGIIGWVTPTFGIYGQIGLSLQRFSLSSDDDVDYSLGMARCVLNLGVTFGL